MTVEEIVARIKAGETDLLPALWERVEGFVKKKANGFLYGHTMAYGMDFDDLCQEGFFAVLDAVKNYDPATCSCHFKSYLANAEVKKNISEAKLAAVPEAVRMFTKPADYQQQISNALAFLTLEGERLTDQAAFAILKPFFNDWEQMHLFERAVLQQMHLENEYMTRSAFPTALGAVLDKADTYTALFGEAEMLAERLFIRKKEHTSACEIGEFPVYGGYGLDSYDEVAAEERIVELAGLIETLGSDKAFVYDSADFKYGQIYQARHQIGSVSPTDTDAGFVWL